MKKSFLVIGLGRFGASVARELTNLKADVLAVDVNEEAVSSVSKFVQNCVIADTTNYEVLRELGVKNVDHAIIAIGNNFQASILTLINLTKLGISKITVKAYNDEYKKVYEMLGATEVIIPEESAAISVANQIQSDNLLDFYVLYNNYVMVKCKVPKDMSKNLIELDIRNKFNVNIVGIIRDGIGFYIPKGTDYLQKGDVAVACGIRKNISEFEHFIIS